MDTFKDKQMLEDLYATGNVPWEVWKSPQRDNPVRKVLKTAQPAAMRFTA
jgi:hypothetical protein